jgi:hypothetical protein
MTGSAKQSRATHATLDCFRLRASALRRTQSSRTLLAMTGERTHVLILATEFVRALHRFHPPEEQRAQGRPGGRCTRGSRAKDICASAKTTGTGGNNRPSLRGGLRLIRALLGEPSRLPPSPPRSFSASLGLGAKALGRQDHTTSPPASASFVFDAFTSTTSPPHVRDVRETPLCKRSGMSQPYIRFYLLKNGNIFAYWS